MNLRNRIAKALKQARRLLCRTPEVMAKQDALVDEQCRLMYHSMLPPTLVDQVLATPEGKSLTPSLFGVAVGFLASKFRKKTPKEGTIGHEYPQQN